MKEKIHPKYTDSVIMCACGQTIKTRSTRQNIHVEICSQCHPFFTGKQKLVDSAGRVDKFKKRYEKKQAPKVKTKDNKKEVSDVGLDKIDEVVKPSDDMKNV